jgi:hypothetical protein
MKNKVATSRDFISSSSDDQADSQADDNESGELSQEELMDESGEASQEESSGHSSGDESAEELLLSQLKEEHISSRKQSLQGSMLDPEIL